MLCGTSPLQASGPDGGALVPPGTGGLNEGPRSADVPGRFTENLGQWGPDVDFMAQCGYGPVAFGRGGVTYDVVSGGVASRVRVAFSGPSAAAPAGVGDLGFPTNFFLGSDPASWVAGARSYRELLYEDVWPDIDVRYRITEGGLKYEVLVGADADASAVRFDVEGHSALEARDGRLDIRLPGGQTISDTGLAAWHEGGEPAAAAFRVRGDGTGSRSTGGPAAGSSSTR